MRPEFLADQDPSLADASLVGASPSIEPTQFDRGWFSAKMGNIGFWYLDTRLTEESFRRYVAALARDIDERAPNARVGVFYEVQSAELNARRRKLVAGVLAAREQKLRQTVAAFSMLTSSQIARGILRALFWVAPPPYPNTIVSTPAEGLRFITLRLAGTNSEALTATYIDLRARTLGRL